MDCKHRWGGRILRQHIAEIPGRIFLSGLHNALEFLNKFVGVAAGVSFGYHEMVLDKVHQPHRWSSGRRFRPITAVLIPPQRIHRFLHRRTHSRRAQLRCRLGCTAALHIVWRRDCVKEPLPTTRGEAFQNFGHHGGARRQTRGRSYHFAFGAPS